MAQYAIENIIKEFHEKCLKNFDDFLNYYIHRGEKKNILLFFLFLRGSPSVFLA